MWIYEYGCVDFTTKGLYILISAYLSNTNIEYIIDLICYIYNGWKSDKSYILMLKILVIIKNILNSKFIFFVVFVLKLVMIICNTE